jgi:hypothetical protein
MPQTTPPPPELPVAASRVLAPPWSHPLPQQHLSSVAPAVTLQWGGATHPGICWIATAAHGGPQNRTNTFSFGQQHQASSQAAGYKQQQLAAFTIHQHTTDSRLCVCLFVHSGYIAPLASPLGGVLWERKPATRQAGLLWECRTRLSTLGGRAGECAHLDTAATTKLETSNKPGRQANRQAGHQASLSACKAEAPHRRALHCHNTNIMSSTSARGLAGWVAGGCGLTSPQYSQAHLPRSCCPPAHLVLADESGASPSPLTHLASVVVAVPIALTVVSAAAAAAIVVVAP